MTLGREIIKLSWVGSEEVGHTAEKRKLGGLPYRLGWVTYAFTSAGSLPNAMPSNWKKESQRERLKPQDDTGLSHKLN